MAISRNQSFPPGGGLMKPPPPSVPRLTIQVRPRMSLYTPPDVSGSFIVDSYFSKPNGNETAFDQAKENKDDNIKLEIIVEEASLHLQSSLGAGITTQEVPFSLRDFVPRFRSYSVTLTVTHNSSTRQVYNATTQLFYLPGRTDGGSITKVDSLYGGLLVQNYMNGSTAWSSLLPYSYFTTLENAPNPQTFIAQGYNMIHLVPDAGFPNQPFNLTALNTFLNQCDRAGLWVMYDMRWTYQNLTSVAMQVALIRTHKSLLLWSTADQPDGHGDPLNATSITYDMLKLLDPWHPVSVLLDCYNFYYSNYSDGADIILSDVYPIGVNTTWSVVYNTVCNRTYGRCGCDDCIGNLQDISTRLDRFEKYQHWTGSIPKPVWGALQAFGNETFWNRYPTSAEEVSMTMLSLNHNAKGIVMWDWPTSQPITLVTRKLGKVLTAVGVTEFLLGSRTIRLKAEGQTEMDVAGWKLNNQMLVSISSLQTPNWTNTVTIKLPKAATSITQVLWGSGQWGIVNGTLSKVGGTGLETDLIIVQLAA